MRHKGGIRFAKGVRLFDGAAALQGRSRTSCCLLEERLTDVEPIATRRHAFGFPEPPSGASSPAAKQAGLRRLRVQYEAAKNVAATAPATDKRAVENMPDLSELWLELYRLRWRIYVEEGKGKQAVLDIMVSVSLIPPWFGAHVLTHSGPIFFPSSTMLVKPASSCSSATIRPSCRQNGVGDGTQWWMGPDLQARQST